MGSCPRFRVLAALLCLCCAAGAAAPKATPAPAYVLPLESFGYRAAANTLIARTGYASAGVYFIDADHLLLTFPTHKLMKRAQDQREGDDDHTVRAEVIHLPDGKIVRETEWRMHDRAPYLWPLANGRFLLRERGDLYSLDPMGEESAATMGRRMVLHTENQIEAIEISPSRDLLLVETSPPQMVGDDPDERKVRSVSADFFAVVQEKNGVVLHERGHAMAHGLFSVAFTSMGILQAVQEDKTHWGFDFHAFDGKTLELGGFTSTCRPVSLFVSDAEFFAFGCRGGDERKLMGGFNLLAEAKWVFTTDDAPTWLAVSSAPAAGRFAVRNTLTSTATSENDPSGYSDTRTQAVRVYSSRDGQELLRVSCSPAQRADGNVALSPDGLRLAVLHDQQLEVYNLPPVSVEDRKLYEREQAALAPLKPSSEHTITAVFAAPQQH